MLLGAALLVALPAAASAQSTTPTQSTTPDMYVVATNNGYLDAHVYAVQGGQVQSLGMVTGLSSAKLKLPRTMVEWGGDVQLLVDPIGSAEGYLSSPIPVTRGDEVALTIQNNLDLSTVSLKASRSQKS